MMHFSLCASLSFCLSLGYTYAHTASVISAQSMPGATRTCCTFNGGLDQGRAGRCSCCLQRTTRPTATTNPQHCCAAVAHDGLDISKVHIDLWSMPVNDEVKRRCQGGGQKPSLTLSCACVIHDAIIMPSFPHSHQARSCHNLRYATHTLPEDRVSQGKRLRQGRGTATHGIKQAIVGDDDQSVHIGAQCLNACWKSHI